MRYIRKEPQPQELIAWIAANHAAVNYNYGVMPGPVRHAIKSALLREQGWLCGYTGLRLDEATSHVEHFKPQSRCTAPGEDVEYRNLLAAYPGSDRAGDASIGFGAAFKAENYDDALLISPWSQRCELRFKFKLDGHVEAANAQDQPARFTVNTLGLDHPRLVGLRAAAIDVFAVDSSLSITQLRRLAAEVDQPDGDGHLRAFCFALKQAITGLISKAEKLRQRRTFARRQRLDG